MAILKIHKQNVNQLQFKEFWLCFILFTQGSRQDGAAGMLRGCNPHQYAPFTRGLVIFTSEGCGQGTLLPLKELCKNDASAHRPVPLSNKTLLLLFVPSSHQRQHRYARPKSRSGSSSHSQVMGKFIFLVC